MAAKNPQEYLRTITNNYPPRITTLPADLTATQIIQSYPNHLEDDNLVLALNEDHNLDSGEIYDLLPANIKKVSLDHGFTRRKDVGRLCSKSYLAGKKKKKKKKKKKNTNGGAIEPSQHVGRWETVGQSFFDKYRYRCDPPYNGGNDNDNDSVDSSPKIRQDETTPLPPQPTWLYAAETWAHPALSTAATYRSVLSGTRAQTRVYNRIPDDRIALLAEGRSLGSNIEHFTAMARIVRKYEKRRREEEQEQEDEE